MADHLLDTQVFIWLATDSRRLSPGVRAVIAAPNGQSFVSLASIWEISIKQSVGKLPPLPRDPADLISDSELEPLNIRMAHIRQVAHLPFHHRDPFDRMLIAQAQVDGLILITDDRRIQRYDVPILRP